MFCLFESTKKSIHIRSSSQTKEHFIGTVSDRERHSLHSSWVILLMEEKTYEHLQLAWLTDGPLLCAQSSKSALLKLFFQPSLLRNHPSAVLSIYIHLSVHRQGAPSVTFMGMWSRAEQISGFVCVCVCVRLHASAMVGWLMSQAVSLVAGLGHGAELKEERTTLPLWMTGKGNDRISKREKKMFDCNECNRRKMNTSSVQGMLYRSCHEKRVTQCHDDVIFQCIFIKLVENNK